MQKNFLLMQNNQYRIIHSARRKKIALRIAPDGVIELLVPQSFNDRFAPQLIQSNAPAIEALRRATPRRPQLDFSGESKFLLLGELFELRHTRRLRLFDDAFLIPRGDEQSMKNSMITLYRELALTVFRKRMEIWENKCGLHPSKIRITSANTRWGSCTSAKVISLSWKLVQCPVACVDYVIVHELSHLKEMNHSALFWHNVANIMPDYQQRQQKLKIFAKNLPSWD